MVELKIQVVIMSNQNESADSPVWKHELLFSFDLFFNGLFVASLLVNLFGLIYIYKRTMKCDKYWILINIATLIYIIWYYLFSFPSFFHDLSIIFSYFPSVLSHLDIVNESCRAGSIETLSQRDERNQWVAISCHRPD